MSSTLHATRPAAEPLVAEATTILEMRDVSHRFEEKLVLDRLSLQLAAGEVHALLGPNGAGKTTLIRILAGLLHPTEGHVSVAGFEPRANARLFRQKIGFLPSGDRTFYLRISALENLVFFGRLHGMRRRAAVNRAYEVLAEVGLQDVARQWVAAYSHGMQKRLAVARALLTSPPVLLIDEATHDLDPQGARRVRDLVAAAAARGSAVIWATQRLDEITGFADGVTLLDQGQVRFRGGVQQLMARAAPHRFVVHLRGFDGSGDALKGAAVLSPVGASAEHFVLALEEGVILGDALAALTAAGIQVLACREERSNVEEAFLRLTEPPE
jgi:ABC-2 type transport system ATP-binding protein